MCFPEAKTSEFSLKEMQIMSVKALNILIFLVTAPGICKSLIEI